MYGAEGLHFSRRSLLVPSGQHKVVSELKHMFSSSLNGIFPLYFPRNEMAKLFRLKTS